MQYKRDIGEVIIIGQHCFNTLGQIRSFGEIGLRPVVIWINHLPQTPKGSRFIKSFHSFQSFQEGLNYVISTFTGQGKKHFLTTDSDAIVALLDSYYELLKEDFFFFNAGSQGRLTQYLQKIEQYQLASKYGFSIPHTELVKKGEFPSTLKYPVFTKAPDSFGFSWKDSAIICHNESELKKAFKKIPTDEFLLQEFIEKDNEVAVEGVCSEDQNVLYMPIQGEYVRLPEGKYGTFKRNEGYKLGPEFYSRIQGMMREIHYSGVFEVEFLRDKKGVLFFLEINFRHTQYNHALTKMGINLCQIWMEICLGNKGVLEAAKITKDPSYVMYESRDIKEYLLSGKLSLKEWIKDFRKADSYYAYDRNDIRFILYYCARMVYNGIKASFSRGKKSRDN